MTYLKAWEGEAETDLFIFFSGPFGDSSIFLSCVYLVLCLGGPRGQVTGAGNDRDLQCKIRHMSYDIEAKM